MWSMLSVFHLQEENAQEGASAALSCCCLFLRLGAQQSGRSLKAMSQDPIPDVSCLTKAFEEANQNTMNQTLLVPERLHLFWYFQQQKQRRNFIRVVKNSPIGSWSLVSLSHFCVCKPHSVAIFCLCHDFSEGSVKERQYQLT